MHVRKPSETGHHEEEPLRLREIVSIQPQIRHPGFKRSKIAPGIYPSRSLGLHGLKLVFWPGTRGLSRHLLRTNQVF